MKKQYVVKKIQNRSPECSYKTYITWDVYKADLEVEGCFELIAECDKRSDAILIAKALNAYKKVTVANRRKAKSTVPENYFSHGVNG